MFFGLAVGRATFNVVVPVRQERAPGARQAWFHVVRTQRAGAILSPTNSIAQVATFGAMIASNVVWR